MPRLGQTSIMKIVMDPLLPTLTSCRAVTASLRPTTAGWVHSRAGCQTVRCITLHKRSLCLSHDQGNVTPHYVTIQRYGRKYSDARNDRVVHSTPRMSQEQDESFTEANLPIRGVSAIYPHSRMVAVRICGGLMKKSAEWQRSP